MTSERRKAKDIGKLLALHERTRHERRTCSVATCFKLVKAGCSLCNRHQHNKAYYGHPEGFPPRRDRHYRGHLAHVQGIVAVNPDHKAIRAGILVLQKWVEIAVAPNGGQCRKRTPAARLAIAAYQKQVNLQDMLLEVLAAFSWCMYTKSCREAPGQLMLAVAYVAARCVGRPISAKGKYARWRPSEHLELARYLAQWLMPLLVKTSRAVARRIEERKQLTADLATDFNNDTDTE